MSKSTILLVTIFLGSNLYASELWSVTELKTKIDQSSEPLVLLDVRTVEEFESGHIRNSINIPHEILLSNIDLVSEYNEMKKRDYENRFVPLTVNWPNTVRIGIPYKLTVKAGQKYSGTCSLIRTAGAMIQV